MTDTTTPTTTTGGSETLSAAELAYFSSGGQDTSGLGLDQDREADAPTESGQLSMFNDGQPDVPAAEQQQNVSDEDADIVVGPDGKPRSATNGQFVPHAALHKERERRKAVETELTTMRDKTARAEERLAVLNELMTGDGKLPQKTDASANGDKSPLDEEQIDPEKDIFGAFRQMQRMNAALMQQMKAGDEQAKAKEAATTVQSAYKADAVAFMEKTPDFKDAYAHLVGTLHRELEAMGVTDVNERNRSIAEQERGLVQQALANKRSPAELIYTIAKTRGFTGAAPQQQMANNGAAKIDNIKKAQSATVSLSRAGGSSGEGLTLDALANMSEEEFSRTVSKLSKSQQRALMGG